MDESPKSSLWNPSLPGATEIAAPRVDSAPEGWIDLGLLGLGGMGEVRAVREPALGRVVALKTLRRELAGDPEAHARFLAEARAAASLEHPGIVPVFRVGALSDGRPFYTMPRFGERTFAALLQAGGDPIALSATLLRAMEAVAYAHARGVVHRDIKPANILLGAFGEVIVADWGLARAEAGAEISTESPDGTLAGAVLGTPGWMAPEQARGEPADARADVWALGLILRRVWAGARAPRPLSSILARATQPDPALRYADADLLRRDLDAFLRDRPVSAHAYSVAERLGLWLRPHRHRVVPALLALTVALTAVLIAVARVGVESAKAARAGEAASEALRVRYRDEALRILVERGDPAAAQLFAAAALEGGEDPIARGALLEARARPRPDLVAVERWEGFDLARCFGSTAYRSGSTVWCFAADHWGLRSWRDGDGDGTPIVSEAPLGNAAVDPSGRYAALVSATRTAIWDLAEQRELPTTGIRPGVDVVWLNDRRLVRVGSDCQMELWDVITGELLSSVANFCASGRTAMGGDGRWLATAGRTDGVEGIAVWEIAPTAAPPVLRCLWPRSADPIGLISIRDGRYIAVVEGASANVRSKIERYDCSTGRELSPILLHEIINLLSLGDGSLIVVGESGDLSIRDADGEQISALTLQQTPVRDGVTADPITLFARTGVLMRLAPQETSPLHAANVRNVRWSTGDAPRVLTQDGHITAGVVSLEAALQREGPALLLGDNALVQAGPDAVLRMSSSEALLLPEPALWLAERAGVLAAATSKRLTLLDAGTLIPIWQTPELNGRARGVAFGAPEHIAVFGYGIGFQLLDARSGALIFHFGRPETEVSAATWCAPYWYFTERSAGVLVRVDPATAASETLGPLPFAATAMHTVGDLIVLGGSDGRVLLRDDAGARAIMPGLKAPVTQLASSPDERYLLAVDQDGTMVGWDLSELGLDPALVPIEVARRTGLRLVGGQIEAGAPGPPGVR